MSEASSLVASWLRRTYQCEVHGSGASTPEPECSCATGADQIAGIDELLARPVEIQALFVDGES